MIGLHESAWYRPTTNQLENRRFWPVRGRLKAVHVYGVGYPMDRRFRSIIGERQLSAEC
jgi:hypothetical protein